MLAGPRAAVDAVAARLKPVCAATFMCGDAAPAAALMKLAVNLYLITSVTGLTEAFHFAGRQGLDTEQFLAVLDAGPLASATTRVKAPKLRARDFSAQAAALDVLKNTQLIAEAALDAGIASPLLDVCHELFTETVRQGHEGEDMVGVLHAIESRTAAGS
jgi:3-hydroxyisobutyrate dehydrogenase